MGRALQVRIGLAFAVRDQTPVDTHTGMHPMQFRLFFFLFLKKIDCFPKFQDQEGFEVVLHKGRDSGKFRGIFRTDELLPSSPLGP